MPESLNAQLLTGLKVIDIAGEPMAMTGRILADMGAEVVKLEPLGGDPLRQAVPLDKRGLSLRFIAWNTGKICIEYSSDSAAIGQLLEACDIVLETPGFPGALALPEDFSARYGHKKHWLKATPFGLQGPRAHWRATDIGIMAACGNMNSTGHPDRAPLRCSEPAAYAHCAAEGAFAVLSAVASGTPQVIDLSMQEAMMIANMGGAAQHPKTGRSGSRQGAELAGTREIWPCKDGYVSFGLRGGPARAGNYAILLEQLKADDLATPAWTERDWPAFNPYVLDETELRAIEQPLLAYFARYSMCELYELAVATNLMLAPANSAREILASEQLHARNLFTASGDIPEFPARFFRATTTGNNTPESLTPDPPIQAAESTLPQWSTNNTRQNETSHNGAWSGTKILEFGSGAAGPIATRYFSEHGACVIRVESTTRPDFLRVMALNSADGLEGSTLFDVLNPGKKSITLNLKDPQGKEIAIALVQWADAVVENFAPKAMKNWGLDYQNLAANRADLVMLSTCLNGQTGPHKDYPGFGGQGAALCGYNFLTGWADREPIGPFGTITDSLSPRFAAAALAAALLYRRRTGKGVYLDVSQVETGVYSLAPWLLEQSLYGHSAGRKGNRDLRAVPHGAFACAEEDRWIAIACWNDAQWQSLCAISGMNAQQYHDLNSRLSAVDEIEQALEHWTQQHPMATIAEQLQAAGIEAVPVYNFRELLEEDSQLAHRSHFVQLYRPVTGPSIYERNGFRLSHSPSMIEQPTPLLGEHTTTILREILNYEEAQITQLTSTRALE